MKFAVSKINITPDWPVYMAGFWNRDKRSIGVAFDIYLRALLLNDEKKNILILSLELCMVDAFFVDYVKEIISDKHGFKKEEILIHTVHTHSGPLTHMVRQVPESRRPDTQKYMTFLEKKIVEAADMCMGNLEEGSIESGSGETYIGSMRREEKDGKYDFGYDLEEPIDRSLFVINVKDSRENIKAVLYNCACHPVSKHNCLGISPDFPGIASDEIEKKVEGSVAVFLQGACGDINNAIGTRKYEEESEDIKSGDNSVILVGRILANDVYNVIRCGMQKTELSLKCDMKILNLPFGRDAIVEIESMKDHPWPRVNEYIHWMLDKIKKGIAEKDLKLYSGYIELSDDIRILALEGEPCNELGIELRELFDGGKTIITGYSNGYTGYIPTARIAREGGYEINSLWLLFGYPGVLGEETEEIVVEHFKKYAKG